MKTPQGKELKHSGHHFAESYSVQNTLHEIQRAANITVDKGYLFNVPEEIKGDLQEAGLHVYKQKKSSVMNLSLSKRVNLLEQELNALKSQARMPVNMIGAGLLHDDFV